MHFMLLIITLEIFFSKLPPSVAVRLFRVSWWTIQTTIPPDNRPYNITHMMVYCSDGVPELSFYGRQFYTNGLHKGRSLRSVRRTHTHTRIIITYIYIIYKYNNICEVTSNAEWCLRKPCYNYVLPCTYL